MAKKKPCGGFIWGLQRLTYTDHALPSGGAPPPTVLPAHIYDPTTTPKPRHTASWLRIRARKYTSSELRNCIKKGSRARMMVVMDQARVEELIKGQYSTKKPEDGRDWYVDQADPRVLMNLGEAMVHEGEGSFAKVLSFRGYEGREVRR